MEKDGPSLPDTRFLGCWLGLGLRVVMVEAPFPGWLLMKRFLPLRLGRTLEGHYRPRMSSFGDRVFGLNQRQ